MINVTEKRKRGQNFSLEEKDRLVKILTTHRDTILNKKTDGSTNEAKCQAWISVTNAFNSSATIYRSKESLIKIWEKMKSESKIYYNQLRFSTTQTGGGPSIIKIDPVLEQVCSIMGRACTGIIAVPDCDADETVLDLPKVVCLGEESPCIEQDLENKTEAVLEEFTEEPNKKVDFSINRTPLWSRRRPQLSKNNERTEATSTLCKSFQDVNKKRETIEQLKTNLLEDEIEFKRKLYNLQLEAAQKEVEIKCEILTQIKGGGLGLQNLFGVPQRKE